jgi:protein involved in polysaccharide export with SLBB domain
MGLRGQFPMSASVKNNVFGQQVMQTRMHEERDTEPEGRRASYPFRDLPRAAWPALIAVCLTLAGCADRVTLPSRDQLVEFHDAGSAGPTVDLGRVTRARIETGSYLVKPGEVLELTMPTVLQIVTAEEPAPSEEMAPYVCRVSETGFVTLPAVGELHVQGQSTAHIEAAVAAAYFPKFTTTRPSVYVRVLEYKTHRVSIIGAVKKPGLYDLRADKMSLVALIMEAQGIAEDGAGVIRISHPDAPVTAGPRDRISIVAPVPSPARVDGVYSASPIRLRFEWTGPLCTSGSLVLERDDAAPVRKWLDIGVPLQRQGCLSEIRNELTDSEAADLETTISRLARWLADHPGRSREDVRPLIDGWHTTDGVQFTTVLDGLPERAVPHGEYAGMASPMTTPAMLAGMASPPEENSQVLLLPVRGLNIPFVDVSLQDGDAVVVEPLVASFVSVLGLVSHPGSFEYPPGAEYNLGQVLALAGGFDKVADPRYATVYRLRSDGSIVHATFQVHGGRYKSQLTDAFSVPVRPGDIVAVEQTPRTRSNQFLDRVFRINIGTYASMDRLWD